MSKMQKYERVLINLCWVFIVILVADCVIRKEFSITTESLIRSNILITLFVVTLFVLNIIKIMFINSSKLYSEKVFYVFRYIEVMMISVFMIDFSGGIEYLAMIFPLTFLSLHNGKKAGFYLLGLSALIKFGYIFADFYWLERDSMSFIKFMYTNLSLISINAIVIVLIYISSEVYTGSIKNEVENARLIIELGEKYEQLEAAQDEIKNQNSKLTESNTKLEETNRRLTSSIAEFYTLQQISEAIGSIFDINELLKFVNDVILGVMGVNYSTIILLDHKKNRLKVQFTNIQNREELAVLRRNINCGLMLDILEHERSIMENKVIPENYEFIKNRDIGSFICIPLSSKARKFGITLIEHKNSDTFDDDDLRLLTTIGKQVSMAIENAELYANLQELATTDGLTGVYNRVYFHQKFESEFNIARELGYDLSLAILDIDHFKKFNDTYGHLFGDIVLKSVAQTIKSNLRASDTIARFGGEEFIIILPHTSLQEAHEKVELLRQKISRNVVTDNAISASVTVSFGMACFPETSTNQIELLKDADNALYQAKECGRNCIKAAKLLKVGK